MEAGSLHSRAVASLKDEGAYAVLAAATVLENEGRDIVHFEIGQPDYPTPKHIIDAGVTALQDGKTTYCNPSGTADLKNAVATLVASTRGVKCRASEVVIGPGCKPGFFFAMMALVEPGDEVIYPDPGFPMYSAVVDVVAARHVPVGLNDTKSGYDLDGLRKAVTAKTRVIVINSPSNPTGGVMTSDDMDAVARIASEHPRLWIISDEIYSRLVYDQEAGSIAPSYLSAAERFGVRHRAILLDGASKTYCMTGWRMGWAVMPETLASRVHLLMVHSIGCSATFTQIATTAALTGTQAAVDEMLAEYGRRRDYVVKRLNSMPGVMCAKPAGAFYVFPDVTGLGKRDSATVASELLHEAGVALLPGSDFGSGGEGHLRISYVREMSVLEKGLDRIEECFKLMYSSR